MSGLMKVVALCGVLTICTFATAQARSRLQSIKSDDPIAIETRSKLREFVQKYVRFEIEAILDWIDSAWPSVIQTGSFRGVSFESLQGSGYARFNSDGLVSHVEFPPLSKTDRCLSQTDLIRTVEHTARFGEGAEIFHKVHSGETFEGVLTGLFRFGRRLRANPLIGYGHAGGSIVLDPRSGQLLRANLLPHVPNLPAVNRENIRSSFSVEELKLRALKLYLDRDPVTGAEYGFGWNFRSADFSKLKWSYVTERHRDLLRRNEGLFAFFGFFHNGADAIYCYIDGVTGQPVGWTNWSNQPEKQRHLVARLREAENRDWFVFNKFGRRSKFRLVSVEPVTAEKMWGRVYMFSESRIHRVEIDENLSFVRTKDDLFKIVSAEPLNLNFKPYTAPN